MPFSTSVRQKALVNSRRRCCVCNKFSGLYTDVHHIEQEADGGPNTLDNAIALCQDCHGEAGHYNPRHPKGTKYKPDELKKHRDNWWEWCSKNPFKPLPDDPVSISPEFVSLPFIAPVSGATVVPFELVIKNRTEKDLYSIWVLINLPSANINDLVLDTENSKNIGKIGANHIKPDTGTILLKLESQGSGLPNYDLAKTSVFIKGVGKDDPGYLGISKLAPNEKRTISIRIKNVTVSQTTKIPLRIESYSEEPRTWLLEQDNSFILNFDLPDKESFEQGLKELKLIDVEYKKRD